MAGCTKDFDELNIDPNKLEIVAPGTLVTPTVYGMATYFTVRSNDFTWEIMQDGLANPSAANGIHRYYFTEQSGDGTWNNCYRYLRNIREMGRQLSMATRNCRCMKPWRRPLKPILLVF